jgi:hypothetical protein
MELDTTELARPEYRETQPLCAEEGFRLLTAAQDDKTRNILAFYDREAR